MAWRGLTACVLLLVCSWSSVTGQLRTNSTTEPPTESTTEAPTTQQPFVAEQDVQVCLYMNYGAGGLQQLHTWLYVYRCILWYNTLSVYSVGMQLPFFVFFHVFGALFIGSNDLVFDSEQLRSDPSGLTGDNCNWHAIRARVNQQPYTTTMCRIRDHVLTNYSVVTKVMLSQVNAAVNLFTISSGVDRSLLSVTLDNCARKLRVINRGAGCSSTVSHEFSLPYQLRSGTYYRFSLEINPARMVFYFECVQLETLAVPLECPLSTSCGFEKNTTIGVLGAGTGASSECNTVSA